MTSSGKTKAYCHGYKQTFFYMFILDYNLQNRYYLGLKFSEVISGAYYMGEI